MRRRSDTAHPMQMQYLPHPEIMICKLESRFGNPWSFHSTFTLTILLLLTTICQCICIDANNNSCLSNYRSSSLITELDPLLIHLGRYHLLTLALAFQGLGLLQSFKSLFHLRLFNCRCRELNLGTFAKHGLDLGVNLCCGTRP